jgi:hypothetical protein
MPEFTTPNGDAPLHDPILADGRFERSLEQTRERARSSGWSEDEIELAFGKKTKPAEP